MGTQIISGTVLMIFAFLVISNVDKWAKPLSDLLPTFFGQHGIIAVLQGRPDS
jgi:hypothetical protein